MRDTNITILEHVTFRLVPQADQSSFAAANAAADGFLAAQPGYRGRTLARRADGAFVDLVAWTDRASAEAAAAAYLADPASAALTALIDQASLEFQHLEVVRSPSMP
jgi:hypothetical protein